MVPTQCDFTLFLDANWILQIKPDESAPCRLIEMNIFVSQYMKSNNAAFTYLMGTETLLYKVRKFTISHPKIA